MKLLSTLSSAALACCLLAGQMTTTAQAQSARTTTAGKTSSPATEKAKEDADYAAFMKDLGNMLDSTEEAEKKAAAARPKPVIAAKPATTLRPPVYVKSETTTGAATTQAAQPQTRTTSASAGANTTTGITEHESKEMTKLLDELSYLDKEYTFALDEMKVGRESTYQYWRDRARILVYDMIAKDELLLSRYGAYMTREQTSKLNQRISQLSKERLTLANWTPSQNPKSKSTSGSDDEDY